MNESTTSSKNEHDSTVSSAHLVEVVTDAKDRVTSFAKAHPAVVPAAAAAVGFGAGMLVSSRLSRALVVMGFGAALSAFARNDGIGKLVGMLDRLARA